MRKSTLLLFALAVAVSASPKRFSHRIIGGSATTINQYPEMVALLFSETTSNHRHNCGGVVLNNRSVLTAAHCTHGTVPARWRSRVGSTNANSGGVVHNTALIINHPQYNPFTTDNDIAILRTSNNIVFTNVVRAARIPGANYNVADNQVVWATGWGLTGSPHNSVPQPSEQLRHVQIWTISQNVCRQRFATINRQVTDNMLCSGWLDVGGRDQCFGDSGGPLFHNGVVVGVCSWGPPQMCADGRFPGVNARVSRYSNWILNNA